MYYYAYAVISREANGDKTLRPLYEGPDLRTAKIVAEDFWEKSAKQVVVKQLGGGVSFYKAARASSAQTA